MSTAKAPAAPNGRICEKWNSDSITFILHILQIRFSLLTLLILPISISNLCEPNLNEVNN